MRNTITVIIFIIVITIISSGVKAQSTLPLQVAPARQELTISPDEEKSVVVKFFNLSDSPVGGIINVADFEVTDQDGTPRIIDNFSQASPKYSASQWFELPFDRMTIPAQDKVEVQVTVRAPKNSKAGGRYVALYFEPSVDTVVSKPGNEGDTRVAPRIAILFYIKIPGETFEKALISRMFSATLQEYGPIILEVDVLNRGDYHIRPRGVLSLSNMLGGIVSQEKLIEQNIFPDAARTYTQELGKKWMFGRYRVDLAASYGETGQAMSRFIYVWVLPWKIMTVIILTLVILMAFGRNYYKGIVVKQKSLEETLAKEEKEIQALKDQLRKKYE